MFLHRRHVLQSRAWNKRLGLSTSLSTSPRTNYIKIRDRIIIAVYTASGRAPKTVLCCSKFAFSSFFEKRPDKGSHYFCAQHGRNPSNLIARVQWTQAEEFTTESSLTSIILQLFGGLLLVICNLSQRSSCFFGLL